MNFFAKLAGLFTSGLVKNVSDTVDKWKPSPTTQHEMAMEDAKVAEDSVESARNYRFDTHDTPFDVFVDGVNRLIRPIVTAWIIGGLMGFWELPKTSHIDPVMLNIAWSVITFWFGGRLLVKDIPNMIRAVVRK